MKFKHAVLFCIFLSIAFQRNNIRAFEINWDDDTAKVGYIHQREYYDTVLELIHKAKKSIVMQMYFVDSTKRGDDPIVFKLVDSLVKAKNRGVKVKCILENEVLMNNRAYTYLNKNGIETYWDHDTQTTHSKIIVIDKKTVVVGSTNWSERALRMNNEASVIIESEKVAQTVLAELSKQKVMDLADADDKSSKDVVYIPEEFLINKKYASKMMSQSSERA
ncbi:MAG: phospholipase D-like domain-containing protein, partial [bacterium]